MCPGFGRREFIGFAMVTAASAAVQSRLQATDPKAPRALGAGPLPAAVGDAAAAPVVAKPTDEATQKLNALRAKFTVPTTDLSDVAGVISADGKTPIGAVAVMELAAAYAKDTKTSWSKALQFNVGANAHNAADTDPDAGSDSGKAAVLNRALFANASNCLKLCATGILGNAEYTSPVTVSGVAGGEYAFPVYPSDMTYIVNGTTNAPGAGQAKALSDLSSALSNRAVVCDYSNSCIAATDSLASTSGGKTPPSQQWAQTLFDARSTTGYQKYLREVNADDSLRDAEKYWHAKESETLSILNEGLSLRVGAVQASAYLATPFDDMLAGKWPKSVAAYDQTIQHYILAKAQATVAGSAASSVKNVASSFEALLTLFTEKPEGVPGLEESVAIRNVFMRLTSFEYLGKSSGIFTNDQINEALGDGGTLITDNTTVKLKLSNALTAFNGAGILGSIAAVIGITRLVLESLLIHDAIGKGEVSPAQALGFAARIAAVYSSFGALRNLTMSLLTAAPTVARTATRILSWNTVSPEMYETTAGAMWSAAKPAADISAEAQAASTSFADAMSSTSSTFTDTAEDTVTVFFTKASADAGAKVPSAQRAAAEQALSSAVEAASTRIVEQASIEQGATLAKPSASLASKAFTASLAGAGLIADLLFVSSDIATIVAGGGMVGASTWLWLVSDGIAVVASGIGVGIALSLFTASSLNLVAIGLTLAAAVIGLIAAAISLPNVAKQTRDEMTATFQRLENDGYLSAWGQKIAFMAVYFHALNSEEPVRFVDPSKSLFDVQGKAFEIFATSTAATDWDKFKECRSSLVGVA
jgi:hypothetical protein